MATEGHDPAFTGIARDALLDHLSRGDPRHALAGLVAALSQALGGPCSLIAQPPDAPARWKIGNAALPDAVRLPLVRLGRPLGWLLVPAGTEPARLAPLLATAAALLLKDAEAGAPPSEGGHAALVLAALAGADTFVWEWDLDSDALSDIDEGLQLLGYAPGALGHTQAAWNELIHPDDRAANHEAYLRHERGEADSYEHTYRARAASGRWRWLQERGRIVERHPDGRPRRMLGTQTDVTERRAMQAAADAAMQSLDKLSRHVPGMLFLYQLEADGRGHFPYASERSRALFGIPPEAFLSDASALLRRVERDERDAMLASIAESARTLEPWRHDFRVHLGGGQVRWMRGDASPQRLADGATLWCGYIEDATERRDLERAREEAAAAAAANRAKTEFLSRMSHELRTPLNAVLGFTQLMEIDLDEPPAEGQRRRLRHIREAGEHLLQMIGDLLDLTRIESGGMALQLEPVDLLAVAEETLAMLRGLAERAQVTLLPAAGSAPTLHADRTRLRQVLLNLVSNAIKYNRPGGSVELRVWAVGEHEVRISVRDTGIGIAEAELPRLFEPFYRGEQARGPVEGTGIGLAVTQALVALMGGRIEVDSRPASGSTFSVVLSAPPLRA